MLKRILLLAVIAVFAMSPVTTSAAEPAAYNWTGFYAGIQGLYGWGHTDWRYTNGVWLDPKANHSIDGGMGGGFVGYNYQFSNAVVIGAEIEGMGGSISGGTTDNGGIGGWRSKSDVNWITSVRGRLGYAFDRFLPFVTVGGAFGGIDIYTQDPGNRTFGSIKEYFGWTAGAGLEYALTRNFTVRAEYSYYDFGTQHTTVDSGYRVRHDVYSHTAKVGVTYRF